MGILQSIFGGGAAEPLPGNALVIDVRSPAEFEAGHLQGAIALPLVRLAHDIGQVAPDKSAPLIVYCQSGARSASARRQLQDMGYEQVVNGGGVQSLAARMERPIVRG